MVAVEANVKIDPGVVGMTDRPLPIVFVLGLVFNGANGVISTLRWFILLCLLSKTSSESSSLVVVHCELLVLDLFSDVEEEKSILFSRLDSSLSSIYFVVIGKSNPVPDIGIGNSQNIGQRPKTT